MGRHRNPLAITPTLGDGLSKTGQWLKRRTWFIGLIFILLGVWSIWFGVYVDPANWSG
jgi:cytochrome c-type biogenesis protein